METLTAHDERQSSLSRKAQYVALLAVAATLALPHQINLVCIGMLLVTCIYAGGLRVMTELVKRDRFIHAILIFFALNLVAAIRGGSWQAVFSTAERKCVLFVLPLLLATITIEPHRILVVLRLFILSVVGAITASFVALHLDDNVIIHRFDFRHYFWQLAEHAVIPSNYLAFYASFAIVLLVHKFSKADLFKQATSACLLVILFFFICAVGARMGFLALIAVLLLRIPYQVAREGKKARIWLGLAIIVLAILSVAYIPYFKSKFQALAYNKDPRYYEFKAALKVFQINPWLGLGFKDGEQEMLKQYERMNFSEGVLNLYNAHNEYFQTAITMGIVGVLVLLAVLYFASKRALLANDFLIIAFLALFLMGSLTESLLSRNKGIVIFAFFTGFFLFLNKNKENK